MFSKKSLFLRVALYLFGIIILSLAAFWLPRLAQDTAIAFPEFAYLRIPVLVGMYATIIPFFYAIYQADYLLRLLSKNKVFVPQGMLFLKKIIYSAYTIVFLYFSGGVYLFINHALHPGIVLIGTGIVFVCAIVIVLAFILQQLLNQVIQMKSENELTI